MQKVGVTKQSRIFQKSNESLFRKDGKANHSSHDDEKYSQDYFCFHVLFHVLIETQILIQYNYV